MMLGEQKYNECTIGGTKNVSYASAVKLVKIRTVASANNTNRNTNKMQQNHINIKYFQGHHVHATLTSHLHVHTHTVPNKQLNQTRTKQPRLKKYKSLWINNNLTPLLQCRLPEFPNGCGKSFVPRVYKKSVQSLPETD